MRVTIENYRGIQFADFTVDGITLVGAPNASGKTSIAQAVQAALNANGLPVPDMTKSMAGFLVRSGATSGFAQVANDNDPDAVTNELTRVEWPKAQIHTEGQVPPSASEFATGALSLVDIDAKKRTTILMEMLDGAPTKENLAVALKKAGVTKPEHVDALWKTIGEIGWDHTHIQTRDKGAKLKGQWEMITGERYGSKKAETFLPMGWDTDLESASEERLQAGLTKAREELEAAIAADAVDSSKRAEHADWADMVPQYADEVAAIEAELPKRQAELQDAHQALTDNPAPVAGPETVPCPCCNEPLVIRGRRLEKQGAQPDEAELQAMTDAHQQARQQVDTANAALTAARDLLSQAKSRLQRAQASQKWLDDHQEEAEKPATETDIDAARERVAQAERLLKAWQDKTQADRIHGNIEKNQAILDILAPGGLRQAVLNDKTRAFVADHIAPLSARAKWADVAFDRDLTITYGGRIYSLLSESEKFRVRVLLQLGIASLEKAKMVVIDAADILDKEGRAGLIRMLHSTGLRCLVCMTYGDKKDLPPISRLDQGKLVWIEGGRAECVDQS